MFRRIALPLAAACLIAQGAVTRVDVAQRTDLPLINYEQITGKIYFAVDPNLPANKIIVDIDRAPRNAQGLVEFSADLYVLRPKSRKSNGTALFEVSNRGGTGLLNMFDLAKRAAKPATRCCSKPASPWSGSAGNSTFPIGPT